MNEEGIVVVKEEKKSLFGRLFHLVMFAVAVYGAVTAVAKVMLRLSNRLEEDNEGNEKKRYLNFMNGRNIRFSNEKVSNVEINAIAGGVELDLTEAELAPETTVFVRAFMSGIVVKVPPMVRVEVETADVLSGFLNMVPNYESENLPVVYLTTQSIMSGIRVEMEPEEE
ncbi:MAG: hypothetical protein J1E35_01100 [Lachnospiraceae bacterium]|nr:hypothetical protein [Lachnospiraceae bacterium]